MAFRRGHPDPFYLLIIVAFGRGWLKNPEPVASRWDAKYLFGIAQFNKQSNTPLKGFHNNIKRIGTNEIP
jgi:hypothetical protein